MVAKLQTGYDEKRLHTLFLIKRSGGSMRFRRSPGWNRTTKYNDCKIIDFSYDNVNVQNIKDAFEHFSDVVCLTFWDPFADKKDFELLLVELKKQMSI